MNAAFVLFAVLCVTSVVLMLHRPTRLFEFPYFMGLVFTVWVLPQLYSLIYVQLHPEAMLWDVSLLSFLCLLCCFLGYYFPSKGALRRETEHWEPHPRRLSYAALLLTLIGLLAHFLIISVPEELRFGIWSGTLTKYYFFARLASAGFALGLFCFLRWRTTAALLAVVAGCAFPLHNIVFLGRREPAAHVFFVTLFVLYLTLRIRPPRWSLAGALAVALLLVQNIGYYREQVMVQKQNPLEALANFDFRDLWRGQWQGEVGWEVKNAMYLVAATKATETYQWGKGYWNHLVFGYVPKQYVGEDVKYGLMMGGLDPEQDYDAILWGVFGYRRAVGSTVTGIGDTFRQFGYGGCLVFFAMGIFFRRLAIRAIIHQQASAIVFYMLLAISAMKSVSHQTLYFPQEALYYTLFIGTAFVATRAVRVRVWVAEEVPGTRSTGGLPGSPSSGEREVPA